MKTTWQPGMRGGMLATVQPELEPLNNLPEKFRRWVLTFLEKCYQSNETIATFREGISPDAIATARSLFCGLRILAQLGDSELWRKVCDDRQKIKNQIDLYYNPELEIYQGKDNHTSDKIGKWRLHDGYLYLPKALKILGLESRPIVSGLENIEKFPWALQKTANLDEWLEKCTAQNPRTGVKEITQYLALYRILSGRNSDEHIDQILAHLENLRDSATGYIGHHDDPGWAMRGHRNNILVFTLYPMGLQEPLEAQKQVMQSTLSLQRDDGLFHDGGMCANMDAIQLLAEYHLQTGLFGNEVRRSADKMIAGILENLACNDGGVLEMPLGQETDVSQYRVTGLGFFMESIRFCKCLDIKLTLDR